MSRYFKKQKFCRFTKEGITEIDYKDLNLLKEYITEALGKPYEKDSDITYIDALKKTKAHLSK